MIFTALPLIIIAVFEQDLNYKMKPNKKFKIDKKQEISYKYATKSIMPVLYDVGQNNRIFTIPRFVWGLLCGVLEGLLCFFFCIKILQGSVLSDDGYNSDMWYLSITLYTAIFLIVDFKLALETRYWIWLSFLCFWIFSIGVYICFQWAYNSVSDEKATWTIPMLYNTSYYYLTVIICLGICFIFELLLIVIGREIHLNLAEYLRYLLQHDFEKYLKTIYEILNEQPLDQIGYDGNKVISNDNKPKSGSLSPKAAIHQLEMKSMRIESKINESEVKEESLWMNSPPLDFPNSNGPASENINEMDDEHPHIN